MRVMKRLSFYRSLIICGLALGSAGLAYAQEVPPASPEGDDSLPYIEPYLPEDKPALPQDDQAEEPPRFEKPDYAHLSEEAEREARLDDLFLRIRAETDETTAELIAEEIWAVWLESGSASVNFLIRRGTAAQKKDDKKLARRMFDHVVDLRPDYAEGWSRSARLAIEEDDLSRALTDVTEALIREPRHFYALWTLGNIFEKLDRQAEALAAYEEAHQLYPALKAVKDRVNFMRQSVEGDVL